MVDWAPVLIGVAFFVSENEKQLEFGSMKTKDKAIFFHTLIF